VRVRVTAPEIVREIAQATGPATVRAIGPAIAPATAAARGVQAPVRVTWIGGALAARAPARAT
jgi:hypothetical protein